MATTVHPDRFIFDRTRQAAPQVLDFLRERILSLELEPGAVLSRLELQKQLSLSQTPVRDALLKLEEEGLVTVFPQYATLVSRINIPQARQLHFMRRAIEADIARLLAASHADTLIPELRRANQTLRLEDQANDLAGFLIADRAYHEIMYRHANMMMIWAMVRTYSGHLDRLRRLNIKNIGRQRIIAQHEALTDAIEAGNPDAAEAALHDHLANTMSMIELISAEYPQFIER